MTELIEGRKYSAGKTRMDLLDWSFIKGIGEVLTYGAIMHAPNNWRKVDPEEYIAAIQRHFVDWREGEQFDKDSGLHHLLHLACNAMFLWVLVGMRNIGQRKDPPKPPVLIEPLIEDFTPPSTPKEYKICSICKNVINPTDRQALDPKGLLAHSTCIERGF